MSYKTFPAIFTTLYLLGSQTFAQEFADGARLEYRFSFYEERGRELIIGREETAKATLRKRAAGYGIHFDAGRLEEYDHLQRMVSASSRGTTVKFENEQLFDWLSISKDFSLGSKAGVTYFVSSANCGQIKRFFPETSVSEKTVALKIKGADASVKAYLYKLTGRWTGSCGSGKFIHEITYAPELGLTIEYKSLNYLPSGFLFQGSTRILTVVD